MSCSLHAINSIAPLNHIQVDLENSPLAENPFHLAAIAILYQGWVVVSIFRFKNSNPSSTALMDQRAAEARSRGEEVKHTQTWVPYDRISRNLVRAVLAGEDSRFFDHAGFDWEETRKALEEDWNRGEFKRGASTITQQLAKNLFLSTSKNPLRKLHEALITKVAAAMSFVHFQNRDGSERRATMRGWARAV